MKILFLTDNFPPELNAPATRTHEHCREWVKEGAEVTVITCFPNFPKGEVFAGYKNKLYQKEVIDGIKVIRVWSIIAENKGIFKRFVDFISFAVTGFVAGLFVLKVDKIIITSPQFFVSFSGFMLSIIKRKPWVFEVRDLWPESIITLNNFKKNWVFKLFENIELYFYKNASLIIVVTEGIKSNIVERGIEHNKINLIRNGFSFNNRIHFNKEEVFAVREELGLNHGDILISYIGTHGQAHGLQFILDVISKITHSKLKFLFVGNGAEKTKLLEQASLLDLVNVKFLDSVPKEKVFQLIHASQWALVNLKRDPLFLGAIPSKIFENAALSTPLLLGVDGEARKLLENYNAGIYFEPENKEALLSVFDKIANGQVDYESLKRGAAKLAQDFDRKILAKEYLKFLFPKKIVENHHSYSSPKNSLSYSKN